MGDGRSCWPLRVRFGLRGISDAAGFPLILAVMSVFVFAATPITNTLSRTQEIEADRFGLSLAREPHGNAEVDLKLDGVQQARSDTARGVRLLRPPEHALSHSRRHALARGDGDTLAARAQAHVTESNHGHHSRPGQPDHRRCAATLRRGRLQPMAVVVLDAAGHTKSAQRQDGASMFRIDIATGKAWASIAMGAASRVLTQRAKDLPAFFGALGRHRQRQVHPADRRGADQGCARVR
jgi:hypothetical protein